MAVRTSSRAHRPFHLRFLLLALASWLHRDQQDAIEYLREENRVLREMLGGRRLRFTDSQRKRLALRGKELGRALLEGVTCTQEPSCTAVADDVEAPQ